MSSWSVERLPQISHEQVPRRDLRAGPAKPGPVPARFGASQTRRLAQLHVSTADRRGARQSKNSACCTNWQGGTLHGALEEARGHAIVKAKKTRARDPWCRRNRSDQRCSGGPGENVVAAEAVIGGGTQRAGRRRAWRWTWRRSSRAPPQSALCRSCLFVVRFEVADPCKEGTKTKRKPKEKKKKTLFSVLSPPHHHHHPQRNMCGIPFSSLLSSPPLVLIWDIQPD
ncbi:hypothetical protein VTO42DRAFT_136 [Malbranchea cinnamomea]